jgi:uncharacterized cofD-like protein
MIGLEGHVSESPLVQRNELREPALNVRPTRIVCMGGGTGLPRVLKGLARHAVSIDAQSRIELTAVVAMSDDGGSSGRLRRTRGILPPGDIRNCLVALAGGDQVLSRIFNYRFHGARGLRGHAVGNLLIAALAELNGNFLEAVNVSARLLNTRGKVLPSTLSSVQLVAELDDSTVVIGERNLRRAQTRIRRVSLSPKAPPPVEGLLAAIAEADLIALGPGSLYSSLLPNLLVDGVAEVLSRSRALKVLIGNLMTQPGETDGMGAEDHVKAIQEHVGPVIDVALLNGAVPPADILERYQSQGAQQVSANRDALLKLGVIPIVADLIKSGSRVRHDSGKVARCLVKLAHAGV